MKKIKFISLGVMCTILTTCNLKVLPEKAVIINETEYPQVNFAVVEIREALIAKGVEIAEEKADNEKQLIIEFTLDKSIDEEGYLIESSANRIAISGGDAKGLMYAGLELADIIKLEQDLSKIDTIRAKPYVIHRGLRFNIPLDARNPSYDDTGDAAQKNIKTVWEWDYWQEYLDQMARNRYNLLTFWSLHPYPSWVKVPEYPEVALEDVCIYTGEVTSETEMEWGGECNQDPKCLKVIKKMTIDEKIAFWQKVFKYAEDRGIDIYLFHWNVFVNAAVGKHGIEWKQDNPVTVDYIRKSVKQMLLTYPNIKGIGVTAGEHINRQLKGKYATENWMWLTYGKGIMDAKEVNPDLDVRFIFRRHWSDLDKIMEAFSEYDGKFETSFKYSRARMYSSVKPPWFDKIYRETIEKYGIKCWLNVRNDDIFNFRWGNPEYAQAYIKNVPYDLTPGFYMGPDGYVWGRVHNSKNPQTPAQLETKKHWYRFMIWGRTAYDPYLPETFYINQIKLKFPKVDAEKLYHIWKATSEIISWVDKIHFRQNDAQFSPEGCFDETEFHDVNRFIWAGAMPEQGVISIADYAKAETKLDTITPFDVADKLDSATAILIEGATSLHPPTNYELEETLGDLKSLGYLGKYYAQKVRGSTFTAMYRVHGNEGYKQNAVEALEKAVDEWKNYTATASKYYYPQLYARTKLLDWEAQLEFVLKDVDIAKKARHGEEVKVGDYVRLWERDKTRF